MRLQVLLVLKSAVFSILNIAVCEILMHCNDVISTSFLLRYEKDVSHAAFPKENRWNADNTLVCILYVWYVFQKKVSLRYGRVPLRILLYNFFLSVSAHQIFVKEFWSPLKSHIKLIDFKSSTFYPANSQVLQRGAINTFET